MEAKSLPIYNTEGKEVDTFKLDAKVFDGKVNPDVIHQAVTAYLANQRRGLAATKTRGEVSGGGKKPWKQKGTGRARVGSTRSPLWRHGGVIFGPHPRSFEIRLPRKIKNLALKSTLNAKLQEDNIVVLDKISLENGKTKEAVKIFSNLKLGPQKNNPKFRLLLLLGETDDKLKLGLRNIKFLSLNLATDASAYEVLNHQKLLITKEGLKKLSERLK